MTTEGLPCWLVLTSTNAVVPGEFYSKLFDRKLENRNEGATIVFQNRSQYECGLSMVVSDNGAALSEWNVYYTIQDCERSLINARRLGAHSIIETQDKPGIGRFSSFTGPDGIKCFIMARE
ncbi:hypothetical protein [Paenibacillus lautus]|uniref:hypothetical protein n=1 Tax=Paenibacillus lautus TaxID=1401 RepID=UPI003D2BBF7A